MIAVWGVFERGGRDSRVGEWGSGSKVKLGVGRWEARSGVRTRAAPAVWGSLAPASPSRRNQPSRPRASLPSPWLFPVARAPLPADLHSFRTRAQLEPLDLPDAGPLRRTPRSREHVTLWLVQCPPSRDSPRRTERGPSDELNCLRRERRAVGHTGSRQTPRRTALRRDARGLFAAERKCSRAFGGWAPANHTRGGGRAETFCSTLGGRRSTRDEACERLEGEGIAVRRRGMRLYKDE